MVSDKIINDLTQLVTKLLFDRFAFQKPLSPCSFNSTNPCKHFPTSDIIFSWLELLVNKPRLATRMPAVTNLRQFILFHHVHGRIHCVKDENNYHTQLHYESISYLNCASLPDFNPSLLHFCQILLYSFLPLVLSLKASFFLNISAYLLKPIILVHNTVIFIHVFFYLGKLHIWSVLHVYILAIVQAQSFFSLQI